MPNFSGKWTLQAQMQAIAAGTWTGLPTPSLFTWGNNGSGRLGLNDVANRSSPVQVGALTDWAQVSGALQFCAAVKTNGTLWSWGAGTGGQLGQNDLVGRSSPVQVGALTDWSQVSNGAFTCAAIKTSGQLWTWGYNGYGQLGQNIAFNIRRSSPVQVGALTDWSQVSVGNDFCAAIKTNGTLWSWGRNQYGQLGQNNNVYRSSPVQVGGLADWLRVSNGSQFCVAIKTNGTIWSWGRNNVGQLGQNVDTSVNQSSPVQVGALTDWSQVSAGSAFCVAVKTNGTLWSWGNNNNGQLGQNIDYNIRRSSPVQVGALTDWSKVSNGSNQCVAIKTNGTLWTWGVNSAGQLGQNDLVDRSSPVQVGALTTWNVIGQGYGRAFSVAITT